MGEEDADWGADWGAVRADLLRENCGCTAVVAAKRGCLEVDMWVLWVGVCTGTQRADPRDERLPILTTGQDFLHSCLHFFGLHLSVLTMAILVNSDILGVGGGEGRKKGGMKKGINSRSCQ